MIMDQTALTVIKGDARIADTHIQKVLGYDSITNLRRLILRHAKELESYGGVIRQTDAKVGTGRPSQTYFLNEAQATLLSMFSRTERAAGARKLLVEVFTAWRKGQLLGKPDATVDPFATLAGRAGHVRDHLRAITEMPALAREVTHMPIWSNGMRPCWFSNLDLRSFVTGCHRQMTVKQCCDEAQKRFGVGPSRSSLSRYWLKLDHVVGPTSRDIPRPPKAKKDGA